MAIEEALTSLLSGVAGGRRHWGRAPQGTMASDGAFLVLNRVGGQRDYSMASATGYVQSRFQIDAYGETYSAARSAEQAAMAALSGYRGTVSGTAIQGIFVDAERDLDAADAGEVSHLFRQSFDILVHHDE